MKYFVGGVSDISVVVDELVEYAPREKLNYLLLLVTVGAVAANTAYWLIWRERFLLVIGGVFIFLLWEMGVRIATSAFLVLLLSKLKFNTENWVFAEKKYEKTLYRILGVKKWKRFFPTYYGKTKFGISPKFVPDKEVLAYNLCLREVVHYCLMFVSLPAMFVILYIGFDIYLFWGLASLHIGIVLYVDVIAIIIQRYNRPRVLKLLAMRKPECPRAGGSQTRAPASSIVGDRKTRKPEGSGVGADRTQNGGRTA